MAIDPFVSKPPIGAVGTLADDLIEGARQRLGLFSFEVSEQKARLTRTAAWVGATVVVGLLALAFACLTLVCVFWSTALLPTLVSLTLIYSAALAVLTWLLRRHLAGRPKPFSATLAKFDGDRPTPRKTG